MPVPTPLGFERTSGEKPLQTCGYRTKGVILVKEMFLPWNEVGRIELGDSEAKSPALARLSSAVLQFNGG